MHLFYFAVFISVVSAGTIDVFNCTDYRDLKDRKDIRPSFGRVTKIEVDGCPTPTTEQQSCVLTRGSTATVQITFIPSNSSTEGGYTFHEIFALLGGEGRALYNIGTGGDIVCDGGCSFTKGETYTIEKRFFVQNNPGVSNVVVEWHVIDDGRSFTYENEYEEEEEGYYDILCIIIPIQLVD